jgi:hypothetical protein
MLMVVYRCVLCRKRADLLASKQVPWLIPSSYYLCQLKQVLLEFSEMQYNEQLKLLAFIELPAACWFMYHMQNNFIVSTIVIFW